MTSKNAKKRRQMQSIKTLFDILSKALMIGLIVAAGLTLLAMILARLGNIPHSVATRYIIALVIIFSTYVILKIAAIRLGTYSGEKF
jgi:heme/copper-type cytochrome/quinol oxidase subunit 4